MNIAIICNSFPTKKNPHHQIFIKNMKENIERDGINVEVCYNKVFDFWSNATERKDIFSNIFKYLIFIYSIIIFLLRNKKKIDILFPQGIIFSTVFSLIVQKMIKVPVVCYVHGGDINAFHDSSSLYQHLVKKSLNRSDYIIVNSRDILDKIFKISDNNHIEIISPGVNTDIMKMLPNRNTIKKKYKIPTDKFILLAAGNAIKRKGFDIFLKSLLHLDKKVFQEIYVVLILEGPKRGKIIKFIGRHNLSKNVSIRDKVDQETLNEYYNAANVFIFPSRDEPLGLVGVESMAAGTIVIGSNVGGIKEYIDDGKNGFLFEKGSYLELADKIEHVYENRKNLATVYKEMNEVIKLHSIRNSANKIINIFRNIVFKSNW